MITSSDPIQLAMRRRGLLVHLVAGLVLLALGAFLVYLGATWVEPVERLASRPVGKAETYALLAAGVVIGLVGIKLALRGRR